MEAKLHLVVEFANFVWASSYTDHFSRKTEYVYILYVHACTLTYSRVCVCVCGRLVFILLTLTFKTWHSALDDLKMFFDVQTLSNDQNDITVKITNQIFPLTHVYNKIVFERT